MIWRLAADAVLVLHLLFILFAVLGGLSIRWRRWLLWLHLPALVWAALVMLNGWLCPLTPLEIELRHWAGESGYSGSFIAHYLLPLIYPPGLTRGVQIALGAGVLLLNLLVYGWLIRRRKTTGS
ncbi:DUF2784 domain-containing protein [Marinobacter halodurans]|uniref:DUF2784 domain-containing protein n=1 Tax=Marinobacter halodurans TaxID=2528979 RepID=A0ABY1ZQ60_9GAMM|nr:DUF2784 domain-containing protein [Marinobacter halodurans]TBW56404.1 DUF2784 domain-containing protein [Marinobacter halodurans]